MTNTAWPTEDVILLKKLWEDDKMTSGQIAKAMNRTRSSIMGMVSRLGLTKRGPQGPTKSPLDSRPVATPMAEGRYLMKHRSIADRPPPEYVPPTQIWSGSGVSILEATTYQCKAVLGTSADSNGLAVLCGEPVSSDKFEFCKKHMALYTTLPVRR